MLMQIITIISLLVSILALYIYMKPNILAELIYHPESNNLNGNGKTVYLVLQNMGYFNWTGKVKILYKPSKEYILNNAVSDSQMNRKTVKKKLIIRRYQKVKINIGFISLDHKILLAQCMDGEPTLENFGNIRVYLKPRIFKCFVIRKLSAILDPTIELVNATKDFSYEHYLFVREKYISNNQEENNYSNDVNEYEQNNVESHG